MARIAYVGPTGVFGGVRILAEHLNRLQARGHECTLIHTTPERLTWLPTAFEQRPLSDPGHGYEVVVGTAIDTWPLALNVSAAHHWGLLQMAEWMFHPRNSAAYTTTRRTFA